MPSKGIPQLKMFGSHRGESAVDRLDGPPERIMPAGPAAAISSGVIE